MSHSASGKRKRVIHIVEDDEEVNSRDSTPQSPLSPHHHENKPTCGICFEEVAIQGVMDSCDHMFDFDCIFEWSKVTNFCPLCKQRFGQLVKKDLEHNGTQPSRTSRVRIPDKKQEFDYNDEFYFSDDYYDEDEDEEEYDEDDETNFMNEEYERDGFVVFDDDEDGGGEEEEDAEYVPTSDRNFYSRLDNEAYIDEDDEHERPTTTTTTTRRTRRTRGTSRNSSSTPRRAIPTRSRSSSSSSSSAPIVIEPDTPPPRRHAPSRRRTRGRAIPAVLVVSDDDEDGGRIPLDRRFSRPVHVGQRPAVLIDLRSPEDPSISEAWRTLDRMQNPGTRSSRRGRPSRAPHEVARTGVAPVCTPPRPPRPSSLASVRSPSSRYRNGEVITIPDSTPPRRGSLSGPGVDIDTLLENMRRTPRIERSSTSKFTTPSSSSSSSSSSSTQVTPPRQNTPKLHPVPSSSPVTYKEPPHKHTSRLRVSPPPSPPPRPVPSGRSSKRLPPAVAPLLHPVQQTNVDAEGNDDSTERKNRKNKVAAIVKKALDPYYRSNRVSRESYKDMVRKITRKLAVDGVPIDKAGIAAKATKWAERELANH
eukprot:TRINITY_DN4849_c2_g1_i1.p1 TRINITY_DN4849_c2_g1~~TRINITY_DN4849_c2_g1_i1.p1  ORF type:complete len:589 (-),score=129.69 TRINITY_DN4849_c2_g1_i1:248-2014(-)